MIKGIHHISMKCASVGELERVKEFYIGLLGMKLKRQWDGGIMIDSGSGLIEVFIGDDGVRSKGAIRHTAFETDDVDSTAERIESAGYEVFIKPNNKVIPSDPEYRLRMAFCYGPLGEEIELFCEL